MAKWGYGNTPATLRKPSGKFIALCIALAKNFDFCDDQQHFECKIAKFAHGQKLPPYKDDLQDVANILNMFSFPNFVEF